MRVNIENRTSYNTVDLDLIISTVLEHERKDLARFTWEVEYAQVPSSVSGQGPFVKFNRNGDEESSRKKIGIVKPKFANLPDLEKITALHTNAMPAQVVREVAYRVKRASECHKRYGRRKEVCEYGRDVERFRDGFAQHSYDAQLITRLDFVALRFDEAEPSAEDIRRRERVQQAWQQRHAAESRLKQAESEFDCHTRRIDSLKVTIQRCIEEVRILEGMTSVQKAKVDELEKFLADAEAEYKTSLEGFIK